MTSIITQVYTQSYKSPEKDVINSSWSLEESAGLVNDSFTEKLITKLFLKRQAGIHKQKREEEPSEAERIT